MKATPLKVLRGKVQLYAFLLRHRWPIAAAAIGLMMTAIGLVIARPGGAGLGIGVVTFTLGLLTFSVECLRLRREAHSMYQFVLDDSTVQALEGSDRYRDYTKRPISSHVFICSREVNRALEESPSPVSHSRTQYGLPEPARKTAPFVLREHFRSGAVIFNDSKLRLTSDLDAAALRQGEPVLTQDTDYFSSLCTNEIVGREIRMRDHEQPVLYGPNLAGRNGVLHDLSASRCSNHIGVSTLAFTADGHIILATQTSGSAQSPNLLVSSGSGSVDRSDLSRAKGFAELIRRATTRELREEIGLTGGSACAIATRLIGYARILERGGKPEFFSVSYVDSTADSLDISRGEVPFIADITAMRIDRTSVEGFVDFLDELQQKYARSLGASLLLNIHFLLELIEDSPKSAWGLITGERAFEPA